MCQNYITKSISAVVEQIVARCDPKRVLLFGSAVRLTNEPINDLDFLVVVDDSQNTGNVTDALNLNIRKKPLPCDFLVVTTSTLEKYRNNHASIYGIALSEGRVVYAKG